MFTEQSTGWVVPGSRYQSHQKAVRLIVQHRLANPKIAATGTVERATLDLANYTAKRLKYNPNWVEPLDAEAAVERDAINTRIESGGVAPAQMGLVPRPRCKTCSRKNKA